MYICSMINSRNKGHKFELDIISDLKKCGYDAKSSRSESKNMDDAGVDIIDTTPFYIQCKRTERSPNFNDVLDSMPGGSEHINIVVHKKNHREPLVTMSWNDFKAIGL